MAKAREAVRSVYEKVAVGESKEELYRAVEDLCMHKFGSWLYMQLSDVCKAHIHELVDGLIGKTSDQTQYLVDVEALWKEHCDQMVTLRNIFLHLDRNFAPPVSRSGLSHSSGGTETVDLTQHLGVNSLWDMGMYYFQERLESRADLESALVLGLLSCVEADRLNVSFDEHNQEAFAYASDAGSVPWEVRGPLLDRIRTVFFARGASHGANV